LEVSKSHFKNFCANNHAASLGYFNYAGLKSAVVFVFGEGESFSLPRHVQPGCEPQAPRSVGAEVLGYKAAIV
jgi:hypothetical protein